MTEEIPEKLSWEIHPIKSENVIKSVFLCFFVVMIVSLSFFYFGNLYALISLIILFFSLNKYFFKTNYILDKNCLIIDSKIFFTKRSWHYFKRFTPMGNYIGLSPERVPTRLDNFRGVTIRLPKNIDHSLIKLFIEDKME